MWKLGLGMWHGIAVLFAITCRTEKSKNIQGIPKLMLCHVETENEILSKVN